ncbi:hypothetical protein BKA82DRAFT_30413 [Pisolithus tinctorius]|uniref:Uncharacterized protein n=1 Tax=Pisolithus tinctorius Marx 270 TaxID=870435 RepID=A0A0C3JPX7_PISTI|nr:hypothetical protein BKA82DRAFT_30413 [Pisolithus tinctorius]KIN99551.1 hypothetical protein M404DRAFT_30413 [Pisolithus tinctorius Marx 270]
MHMIGASRIFLVTMMSDDHILWLALPTSIACLRDGNPPLSSRQANASTLLRILADEVKRHDAGDAPGLRSSHDERGKKRGRNTDAIVNSLFVPVEDVMSLEVLPSPPFVIWSGSDAGVTGFKGDGMFHNDSRESRRNTKYDTGQRRAAGEYVMLLRPPSATKYKAQILIESVNYAVPEVKSFTPPKTTLGFSSLLPKPHQRDVVHPPEEEIVDEVTRRRQRSSNHMHILVFLLEHLMRRRQADPAIGLVDSTTVTVFSDVIDLARDAKLASTPLARCFEAKIFFVLDK